MQNSLQGQIATWPILYSDTFLPPLILCSIVPLFLSCLPLTSLSVPHVPLPTKVSVSAHPIFLRQHNFVSDSVLQQKTLVWASGLTIKLWCWDRENSHTQRVLVFVEKSLWPILCLDAQSSPTPWNLMDSSVHGDSPGKNTGVGCHVLLQGIFPTQGLNPGLPHCRWILYHLSQKREAQRTKSGSCNLTSLGGEWKGGCNMQSRFP